MSAQSISNVGTGIISSTGIGSGLNVSAIISQLVAVDSQPLTTLQNQQASYQTELSAFGTLNGSLSSFQNSLATLSNAATFNTLSASSSNSSVATATAGSSATTGNYSVNVSQLAQAQTISSTGQASETGAIGSGTSTTISFQFGTVTGTATNGTYSGATFTADPTQAIGSVTINSSNNSLEGIASAINSANVGVQATIVGDGSANPYHLVLTSSKTGATSSMNISVSGDSTLQGLLSYNPAGTQNLTQITAGQNANLTLNGIAVTSTSNTISNSVQGLTFTATGTGSANISVSANTSAVTNAVNSLVANYNSLNSTIAQLTAYNATTQVAGPLLGNPTIAALKNQLSNIINGSVNGLSGTSGGLVNLAQAGVTLQSDGTLAVNSTTLQSVLSSNFQGVSALFSSTGNTTDSLTNFVSATTATQAGNYAVNVSALATHGSLIGNTNLNSAPVTIAANTQFNATVDGTTAAVSLAAGTYTATQFAALLQSAINTNTSFSGNGLGVSASIDSNGYLNVVSNSYGKASNVSLANSTGTTIASLLGTVTTGTSGADVTGTIDGISGVGNGQSLTGASGSAVDGLEIQINGGSTGSRGTVSYSEGYAYQLSNLMNSFLNASNGVLTNATSGINSQITSIQTQETNMQAQISAEQASYQAEFSALDTVESGLQSTQSFLTSELGVLNGTTNG